MSCQDHAMLLSCYAEITLRSFHGQESPQDDTGEMRRDRLQLWNRRDETGPLLDAQWTLNGRSMDAQWTLNGRPMDVWFFFVFRLEGIKNKYLLILTLLTIFNQMQ